MLQELSGDQDRGGQWTHLRDFSTIKHKSLYAIRSRIR